ncbi:hypothetical protein [Nonomuraea sp. NPDC023979]|uniref:hypothetical protein n=1 Tax=Nonomuraea sp. NPDC023979 TaxID=3154796 RepID=UPI0033D716AE
MDDLGTLMVTTGVVLSLGAFGAFVATVVSIRGDDRRRVPEASPASPRRFRRRVLGTYTRHRAAIIRRTMSSPARPDR